MEATQIPPEIDRQFEKVADLTGEPKSDLVRDALLSYLEEFHLAQSAEERLKDIGERTSLADIGRDFGLAD